MIKNSKLKPVLLGVLALVIISGLIVLAIFIFSKNKKNPETVTPTVTVTPTQAVADGITPTPTNTVTPTQAVNVTEVPTPTPDEPDVTLTPTPTLIPLDGKEFASRLGPEAKEIKKVIIENKPVNRGNFNSRFQDDSWEGEKGKLQEIIDEYVFDYTAGQVYQFHNLMSCYDDTFSDEYSYISYLYVNMFNIIPDDVAFEYGAAVGRFADGLGFSRANVCYFYPYFVSKQMPYNDCTIEACIASIAKSKMNDVISAINAGDNANLKDYTLKIPLFYSFVLLGQMYPEGDVSSHEFVFGIPGEFSDDDPEYVYATANKEISFVLPIKDMTAGYDIFALYDKDYNLIGIQIFDSNEE